MRQFGHFKEYEDYRQFRRERHGVDTTPEERQDAYKEWKKDLPAQEQADFNEMFGE